MKPVAIAILLSFAARATQMPDESAPPVTHGLAAAYMLPGSFGAGRANDFSVFGRAAGISNATVYGNGVRLTATNSVIQMLSAQPNFNSSNAFSVLVRFDKTGTTGALVGDWDVTASRGWNLFKYGEASTSNAYMDFTLSADPSGSTTGSVRVATVTTNYIPCRTISVTYDGSGAFTGVRGFYDLTEYAMTNAYAPTIGNISSGITNNIPLMIGSRKLGGALNSTLQTTFRCVLIYSRALSADEVKSIVRWMNARWP